MSYKGTELLILLSKQVFHGHLILGNCLRVQIPNRNPHIPRRHHANARMQTEQHNLAMGYAVEVSSSLPTLFRNIKTHLTTVSSAACWCLKVTVGCV